MNLGSELGVYLDLDGAWADAPTNLRRVDAGAWGPALRFSTPRYAIEQFYSAFRPELPAFVLYGSGDFHHLSALRLRRFREPVSLVAFDNHPDWDVRPPSWCCGGWINRALDLPCVERVSVWGCGNFECWWPHQLFGNRRAERSGRLSVQAWADERPASAQKRRGAILRETWRDDFLQFVSGLSGAKVYVTIDLDCLAAGLAWTNWENGRFNVDDLEWALQTLRQHARIVAGDLCGAYSEPTYARRKQRFASEADHPKLVLPPAEIIRSTNRTALERLWPSLAQ